MATRTPHHRLDRARYMPTPAEIRARCEEIQSRWDAATRARRRACRCDGEAWTVPEVSLADDIEEAPERTWSLL